VICEFGVHTRISNTQCFEPIGTSKSPVLVDDPASPSENALEVHKRKTTSVVWNHYKIIKVDGKPKAKCNYCQKNLLGDPKQGTSHLHDHLDRCKMRKFKDIRDMCQPVLITQQNKMDGKMSLNTYQFDQDQVRRGLARMVILHEYPLSMVDHIGFREFVGLLQPIFKMICRNTLKKDIFKIYDNKKEKALQVVDKNESRIAITTDMWTSSNKKRGFMVVTTHFVNKSWTLESQVLS
jgi:hypothetical protein